FYYPLVGFAISIRLVWTGEGSFILPSVLPDKPVGERSGLSTSGSGCGSIRDLVFNQDMVYEG
ncbi:MAG TPA: hypothetical protein PKK41_04990, partial [Methanoculleus sp.]|nr:hypothetical protein [Methanoculleus sp.]